MVIVIFLHLKTFIFCTSQMKALILQFNLYKMKRIVLALCTGLFLLTSCNQYNNVLKSNDYEYKYEVAKECFVKGEYSRAVTLFSDLVTVMKGTVRAEEALYMLAMSEYCDGNFDVASSYFKKYYQSYPKGTYVEFARFYCAKALYESVPDVRLDQTNTYAAIKAFQEFLDYYPYTKLKNSTQDMIYALQDKLVEKEYLAAKLYYDLGTYMGNCSYGGSNYEACIVTAQNALLDYPYATPKRREEFAIMILRAKYHLAVQSVEHKRIDRFRDAIDEYYGFVNEYPESKYLKDAQQIFAAANKMVNKK